ncbi:MAG: hypothetical protein ABI981_11220 [Betaproteobacteria bacterium]
MALFSVTLPVIAILDEKLFVGHAVGHIDRTGSIELLSVLKPKVRCTGRFRYTSLQTGVADMRCDDGVAATLAFDALGVFSGHGHGSTPKGPASFTFGLDYKEAARHLTLPDGTRLAETLEGLRLQSAGSSEGSR